MFKSVSLKTNQIMFGSKCSSNRKVHLSYSSFFFYHFYTTNLRSVHFISTIYNDDLIDFECESNLLINFSNMISDAQWPSHTNTPQITYHFLI
ncbi:hypothetical protein DERF_006617 [Dermatophagoides farinae]|uniref:Uncharacterized protein n=1 Tax=Dermatophagoides farinae TaxID=6954 RepID=A0A922HZP2_DERFA|nr:hypothetical protein DERF_006617 [Dermatophagoides farinae]